MNLAEVEQAADRLQGVAHRTPVLTCSAINDAAGKQVFLKCEQFQKVGAFKFRGAFNAVSQLEDASRGVVTHSSGNHAQALALAARLRGVAAHIVMPSNAPEVKKRAVRGYGGRIVECEPTLEARETTASEILLETGGSFVHPYDDPRIIAGQATVGKELLEQQPQLDAVIGPVGGGGLIAGIALAARHLLPSVRVFAGEPHGADDAYRSKEAGHLIPQTGPETIADGLLTSLGELTWPIVRDHVESIFRVTDDQIREAMLLLWERAKLVVEPSGAVSLAAVLSDEFRALEGVSRVGVVLSGGNLDVSEFLRSL